MSLPAYTKIDTLRARTVFDLLDLDRDEYNELKCTGAFSAEEIELHLADITHGMNLYSLPKGFELSEATKDVSSLIVFLVKHSESLENVGIDPNSFDYLLKTYLSAFSLYLYAIVNNIEISDYAIGILSVSPWFFHEEALLKTINPNILSTDIANDAIVRLKGRRDLVIDLKQTLISRYADITLVTD